jgi:methylase of polypeptide subunit release factors
MIIKPENDPLGQAIYNYEHFKDNTPVNVQSTIVEDEELPPDYFFRKLNDMPLLERIALKRCRGNILDIGAGAGCHSLCLQKAGHNVTALDVSQLCCETMEKRGVKKVINSSILSLTGQRFDTLLLLMNGIGIAKNLDGLKELLEHLKNLLEPGGSILLDSSDLIFLYKEEDGSVLFDINSAKYYGEIDYQVKYKNITGETFSWLFADNVILFEIAEQAGFKSKLIEYGPHYDYLAELTLM